MGRRTSAAISPGRRWRRALLLIGGTIAVVAGVAPWIVGTVAGSELSRTLDLPISLGRVTGWTSREVRATRVQLGRWPQTTQLTVSELWARCERPPWRGDPGEVEEIRATSARCTLLFAEDSETTSEPTSAHAEVRSVAPPTPLAPESTQPIGFPQRISLRDVTFDIVLPGSLHTLALTELRADCQREEDAIVLERGEARMYGGTLRFFGRMPRRNVRAWSLQATLDDVDLAALARGTPFEGRVRGRLSGYLDLRGARPTSLFQGAGWLAASDSQVWELPVFAGLLDALGLIAGAADEVREARVRYRIDAGVFQFTELFAVGRPVSLHGNGSMALDGSWIDADFVPRLGRGLTRDLPVVGEPSQILLDVAKGLAVEVQLRGRLTAPEVSVLPLPVVTRGIQEFFQLVGGR